MNAPTSVISAAVVGGDLVLGLSDGSIINAGRVQGPKGLTGDQGPMGATGLRGTDGNTILSFEGAPQPSAGKDGDFAINVVAWEIYGPKAGGQWGTGTPLRGDTRSGRSTGERTAFDSPGAGGNGQGGGGFYNTANLSLAGTGKDGDGFSKSGSRIDAPGGIIVNPGVGLKYQSNANRWYVESIGLLDAALGKTIEDLKKETEERIKGDEELKDLIDDAVQGAIRSPIYSDTLPTSHPDYEGEEAKLIDGDRWFDTSNDNLEYRYRDGEWKPTSRPPIYADDEPDTHPGIQGPGSALEQGDIWYDSSDSLKEYIWDGSQWVAKVGDYLPLTGGDLSGQLNVSVNSGVALSVNNNKVKFWSSGAIELPSYTAFKDNELITKKYADDAIETAVENIDIPDVDLTGYLPLTGGTVTGNLTVEGQAKFEGNDFKIQYPDDTAMIRVQPNADNMALKAAKINTQSTKGSLPDADGKNRSGVEIQVKPGLPLAISNTGSFQETFAIYGYDVDEPGQRAKNLWIGAQGNINTEGNVNAQSFVKGSELRSTKLTSGQSSNLQIYRGSGENEDRKMLIGTDSVNFDVGIKLTGSDVNGVKYKDIQVLNGTKLYTGADEIITFGGTGAFYRGAISQPDHLVNREYVDAAVADNADEDNSKSRLSLGTYTLRTSSGQPSGNATAGELTLWHLDPSEAATTPVQEFKVGGGYGHTNIYALVQDIAEKSLGDNPVVWYFVQGDKEQRMLGQGQGWTTTGTYHSSGTDYSGDVLIGGEEVELFVEADLNYIWQKQEEILPEVDANYYKKTGGNVTGFVRVIKPDGVAFGTRTSESADNNFQVWADGIVDFKNKIQFTGSTKSIYSGSTEMIDFSGANVRIPRKSDNSIGFQLKGKSDADDNLFNVYHRPDKDEIMYRGKINDPNAIVTKSWVEQNAGGFSPGERVAKDGSAGVAVGGFYIQNGNIFAKIS